MSHVNFDVAIERRGERYRARVFASPFGEPSVEFDDPLAPRELEDLAARKDAGARTRGAEGSAPAATREIGARLFTAAFQGPVWMALTRTLDDARRRGGEGARIRLHLRDAGPLAEAPWEFLYNPEPGANGYVALRDESPIVRYLALPEPDLAMPVSPPLRLMAVVAAPDDPRYALLDGEREWRNMQVALGPLQEAGSLELTRLRPATLAALHEALTDSDYHIFHFVGHGLFDEKLNDGALVFERPDGSAHEVPAENVGTLLRNERALRLAVLNACEGGRSSATDPYAGISQSLVRAGVPAVVGMQFAISDQAAIDFSRQLYRAVARGRPIDMAVTAARMAVYQGGSREWATPVLYLRSPDARIFDVGTAQDARVAPPAQAKRREVEQLVVAETLRRPSASPAKTAPSDWKRHLVRMGGAAVATWILFAIVVLGLERVLERPGAAWPANTNRGGLIYEAKLDAAGSALVPVFTSPTAVSQPHDGSHDLVVASAKSEIAVRLAYSPPERYAAEMLVEVRPGSTGLNLVWEVAQSGKITYTLELDPTAGSVVLRWNDNTATGGVLAQAPMRGTLSGRQIQLGIIIDAPRYVIVVDGAAAADGQDGALKPEVRPMAIHLFGNEQNASGTVTIYAIRVYALQ